MIFAPLQVQNIASPRPMIPTSSMPVGTPLLEWNGTEWITPQQSSLAAVAAGQQGNRPGRLTTVVVCLD